MNGQKTEVEPAKKVPLTRRISLASIMLLGFSVVYFTRACLFASEKYFWYDELITVYTIRSPTWHAMWDAMRHGFDFNPPLFAFIMRLDRIILGEGLIATRIPQIVGFWVFCVCLFRFVNRRAGLLAGYVTLIIPLFTKAFFYAFDARPHGLVLGFCGLSLYCWQKAGPEGGQGRVYWLFGFGLSILAALMTHCYAIVLLVPFALVELFRCYCSRRLDWKFWLALAVPAVIAVLTYIPLLAGYRKLCQGTDFGDIAVPKWNALPEFYSFLFTPCLLLVYASLVLMSVRLAQPGGKNDANGQTNSFTMPEILLAVCFLGLPVFGILLGQITHGPFAQRYLLSATAGFSILIGMGVGSGKKPNWASATLALALTYLVVAQFVDSLGRRHRGHTESFVEPSTGFSMNVSLHGPLERYSMLTSRPESSLPIVVSDAMDFLYLVNYAPEIAPHLYYINRSEKDLFVRGFRDLQQWIPIKYNQPITLDELVRRFPEFFLYTEDSSKAETFNHDRKFRFLKNDNQGHFLIQLDAGTPSAARQ